MFPSRVCTNIHCWDVFNMLFIVSTSRPTCPPLRHFEDHWLSRWSGLCVCVRACVRVCACLCVCCRDGEEVWSRYDPDTVNYALGRSADDGRSVPGSRTPPPQARRWGTWWGAVPFTMLYCYSLLGDLAATQPNLHWLLSWRHDGGTSSPPTSGQLKSAVISTFNLVIQMIMYGVPLTC